MDRYFDMEFWFDNLPFTIALLAGLLLILAGLVVNISGRFILMEPIIIKRQRAIKKLLIILDKITSVPLLRKVKENIKSELEINIPDEENLSTLSGVITLAVSAISLSLVFLLKDAGQLWYVRLMLAAMGLIVPYYIMTLLFDLYKYHIGRQIPKMIDEFRSAFIKHNRIRPALKECSLYIKRGLGRIISRTADSTMIEERLEALRNRLNNVWFNIFATLVLNYKENGGELIDQLYRLNRTMTRYTGIEKKKNKRLLWYELFAVTASVISIPAVFWLNNIILGNDGNVIIDAQSNILVSRIIGFSILSLVTIRILRKM